MVSWASVDQKFLREHCQNQSWTYKEKVSSTILYMNWKEMVFSRTSMVNLSNFLLEYAKKFSRSRIDHFEMFWFLIGVCLTEEKIDINWCPRKNCYYWLFSLGMSQRRGFGFPNVNWNWHDTPYFLRLAPGALKN